MLVRNQDLVISEIPKCLRNTLLSSFIYPSAGTIQVDLFYPSVFANFSREATCSVCVGGETKALEWSQNAPHSPEPWTSHTGLGASAFLCKRNKVTPTSGWLRGPCRRAQPYARELCVQCWTRKRCSANVCPLPFLSQTC